MKIWVQSPSGDRFKLSIKNSTSIGEILIYIKKRYGINNPTIYFEEENEDKKTKYRELDSQSRESDNKYYFCKGCQKYHRKTPSSSSSSSSSSSFPVVEKRKTSAQSNPVQVLQSKPVQSKPVQSKPVQSNPVQSNPVRSNPVQVRSNPVQYSDISKLTGILDAMAKY